MGSCMRAACGLVIVTTAVAIQCMRGGASLNTTSGMIVHGHDPMWAGRFARAGACIKSRGGGLQLQTLYRLAIFCSHCWSADLSTAPCRVKLLSIAECGDPAKWL